MKGMMAVVAVLAMLGASVALAGLASAGQPRSLVPVVETGSTDRLGGGDWISVRAGDARVGVVYGTVGHPNKLYVFAEYKRFLGGADIYDSRGNYLQTRGIPVYVVFGQSFDHLIEFQDTNNDSLFNLYRYGRNDTTAGDQPVKATGLVLAWTATVPSVEPAGNTTYVNFTVGTPDLPYDLVWDGATSLPRRGTPADGALDRLNFTFHLKVDVREVSGEVPWFRVSVSDGTARTISDVLYEGTRNYSGSAVAMGAKYDHLIEGWDFAAPTNLLALETRAFLGYFVPERVAQFIHAAYRSEATDNGTYRQRANDTMAPDPRLLTRDYVYFNDEWDRATDIVGRLVWRSDVTVDGRAETMLFQVQGGELFRGGYDGTLFQGFAVIGAYIYPAGARIEHDPGLDAVADLWNLPSALNLTPFTVLAIQAIVAAIAMGAAILVRAKGRRAQ